MLARVLRPGICSLSCSAWETIIVVLIIFCHCADGMDYLDDTGDIDADGTDQSSSRTSSSNESPVLEHDPFFSGADHKNAVELSYLESMLPLIGSPFDLLRIQYGHDLSDQQIESNLQRLLQKHARDNLLTLTDRLTDHPRMLHQIIRFVVQKDYDKAIETMDLAYQRFDYVREHTECRDPRPVVFDVSEFHSTLSVLIPSRVLLHRCGSANACCVENGESCTPMDWEDIVLEFFVGHHIQTGPSGPVRVYFDPLHLTLKLSFTNHTRCECQKIDKVPTGSIPRDGNACRTCPEPFHPKRINAASCDCDCFDGQADCIHIKRGWHPFKPETLRCLQDGRCQAPKCKVWVRRSGAVCPCNLKMRRA